MIHMSATKQVNLRLEDEVKDKLYSYFKENGLTHSAGIQALLHAAELSQASTLLGNRKTEIEDFQAHLNAISDIYLMSLQFGENAEERVRQEFTREIDKVKDLERIADELRTELRKAKEEIGACEGLKRELAAKDAELKAKDSELTAIRMNIPDIESTQQLRNELQFVKDQLHAKEIELLEFRLKHAEKSNP